MLPVFRYRFALAVLLPLITAIPFAVAAETDDPDADPLWEMRLAAFGRYGPSYPASEDKQFNIIPLPLPIYRGKFLRLGDETDSPIRGRVFRRDKIKLDLAFDLNFPVDSDDVDAREGMPDLDLLLEAGPELELEFASQAFFDGRWFFSVEMRPAFSFDGLDPGYEGIVLTPELTYRKKLGKRRNELKISLASNFANSKYMDYFYTVEPSFATADRPAYEADSGYLGTDLQVSWVKSLGDDFELFVASRLSFHQGAANEDSPLFTEDTTISVFAAFMWTFWESERRASEEDSLL